MIIKPTMKNKVYSQIDRIPTGDAKEGITQGCMVLEGGALRGVYTSGVLDFLMEQGINLETTIGISAGAMCGICYATGDIGRAARTNLGYRHDKRYIGSLQVYRRNKGVIGFDFCFGELNKTLPIHFERLDDHKRRFIAVATSLETGKAVHFEYGKCSSIIKAIQASASMPYVSKPVMIDDKPYLDGGVEIKTPYKWALEQGYSKIVLVMTRHRGFRLPLKKSAARNAKLFYGKYKDFAKTLGRIQEQSNLEYDEIDRLTDEGRIFTFYPSKPLEVSRLEKNMEKLGEIYWLGYHDAENRLEELKKYLEI